MAKRIKKFFSTADHVLHLWANQSQTDARSRNVFFDGDTCYSYGHHYKLGRIHEINGYRIVLINSYKYSNTTAKHQSWAKQAVEHMPNLWSSDVDDIETALLETQEKLINNIMSIFNQMKFYSWDNDPIGKSFDEWMKYKLDELDNFNRICDIVDKSELKIEIPQEFLDIMFEHFKFRFDRSSELLKEAQIKREKERKLALEKAAIDLKAWKLGGPLTSNLRLFDKQLIRIVGEIVETTQGAEVPLNHAKRLLRKVLNKTVKVGDRIGHFTFDSIKDDIVQIGCHKISLTHAKEVLEGV